MGAWSTDIIGSDNALDALGCLGELIGLPGDKDGGKTDDISLYPLPLPNDRETIHFISDALTKSEDKILSHGWKMDDWPVVAVAYLATGTKMPPEVLAKAMHACQYEINNIRDYTWTNPRSRVSVLKKFINLLDWHEPGKITSIEHKGLLRTMIDKGRKPKAKTTRQSAQIEERVQEIMQTIRDACGSEMSDETAARVEAKVRANLVAMGTDIHTIMTGNK